MTFFKAKYQYFGTIVTNAFLSYENVRSIGPFQAFKILHFHALYRKNRYTAMRSIIISRSMLAILTNLVATIRDQYRDARYLKTKHRILDEIEIFLSERDYYFVKITQSMQITHQLFSVFHDYVIFYLSNDLDNISRSIQLIPYLHNILFLSTRYVRTLSRDSREFLHIRIPWSIFP